MPGKGNGVERKFFAIRDFKAIDVSPDWPGGGFTGHVNNFGNLDEGGDIVIKGAYADVIEDFLATGFTAHSHYWDVKDGVIGYPMDAVEDDDGLFVTHKFHTTPDAQLVRQKSKERQDDNKQVGLSIGYQVGAAFFILPKDYDAELPKYLKSEYLAEGLAKARSFPKVRVITKIKKLAESSIVTSPMNTLSGANNVKGEQLDLLEETPEVVPPVEQPRADSKAGARNSAADITRVQKIHDMAVELHNAACPAWVDPNSEDDGKAAAKGDRIVQIKEQIKGFFAKGFAKVKGMFESALEEMTAPSCWQVYYAYLDVVDQIADLAKAAVGTDVTVDVDALVDEALAAMSVALREATMKRLGDLVNQPEYDPWMYYGMPPADSRLKFLQQGLVSEPLKDHSAIVVSAVEEANDYTGTLQTLLDAYIKRLKDKQEFRKDDENRNSQMLSAEIRDAKKKIDASLQQARDKVIAAAENSTGLQLLEPSDLTAELLKQKLLTERRRTAAMAR